MPNIPNMPKPPSLPEMPDPMAKSARKPPGPMDRVAKEFRTAMRHKNKGPGMYDELSPSDSRMADSMAIKFLTTPTEELRAEAQSDMNDKRRSLLEVDAQRRMREEGAA